MTITLIVGLVLAAAALAYVMLPLLVGYAGADASNGDDHAPGASSQGSQSGQTAGAAAIDVLREIEFDRATGKLSDADYGGLKASYTALALAEMRDADLGGGSRVAMRSAETLDPPTSAVGRDARLAVLSSPNVCPACGPRPEPDARYCSNCARFLAAACAACGAPVTQPAARHCSDCGHRLAA